MEEEVVEVQQGVEGGVWVMESSVRDRTDMQVRVMLLSACKAMLSIVLSTTPVVLPMSSPCTRDLAMSAAPPPPAAPAPPAAALSWL